MGTGLSAGDDRGSCRLYGDDFHIGLLVFQIFSGAGEGSAGADAGHEEVDITFGIFPDFRTGGLVVSLRVGRVHELAGDEAVRDFLCQLFCLCDGAGHALAAVCQNQLCAVGSQKVSALHAHGLRHGDDDPVALGGGHGSQADAGVAAGGLDDDGVGLEYASCLGIFDHCLSDAVFDAAGRVEVFELGENTGVQAFCLLDAGELQKRGIADEFGDALVNSHKETSWD